MKHSIVPRLATALGLTSAFALVAYLASAPPSKPARADEIEAGS